MHEIPNLVPDVSCFVDFLKREHLFHLKIIQIFIDSRSLNDILLRIILVFMIVILDLLSFFKVVVIEIPDSMAENTFLTTVHTKSTKIKSAQRFFALRL
jgi:hypothetical protein